MTDSHPVLQVMGIDARAEETPPAEPQPIGQDAATPDATAPAAPESEESETLDEAMAALDDPGAPPHTQPATDALPTPEPSLAYTPEQIAALVAENERFKAEQAQAKAEAEATQWDTTWDEHIANGQDWYAGLEGLVRDWCQGQGMSKRETEGVVKEVVLDGHQLHEIPGAAAAGYIVPPGTPGYLAWKDSTLNDRNALTKQYLSQKAQPSAVETLAQQYQLDETDRTALGKFVNYPREHLEEIARTLGAKNQRVATTHTAITQQAAHNLAARFSPQQQAAPGAGSASPPKKPYQFTHRPEVERAETELIAKRLRLIG